MLFQSILKFAVLLPALLVSAYPHAHERRIGTVDEVKLYPYPPVGSTSETTPFATIVIGYKKQDEKSGTTAYDVEYKPEGGSVREAMALIIPVERHDRVVATLQRGGTYIASGIDAEDKIWVVVTLSDSPDQELESSVYSDSTGDEEYDSGIEHY